jgi:hypothetical protein
MNWNPLMITPTMCSSKSAGAHRKMQALQERALARIWCSHAPYRAHNRFGSGDMLRTGCPCAHSFKHTSEPVLSLLLLNLEQDVGLNEAADNPI